MFKRKNQNQNSSINPAILNMIRDIQTDYPGATYSMDLIAREYIISANVNNDLLFRISLPYNFPAVQPVVSVQNADEKYLAGLESLSESGLLDPKNGQIFYNECFGWTPDMRGSTLLYLLVIMVKTATKTSRGKSDILELISRPQQSVIQSSDNREVKEPKNGEIFCQGGSNE